jgi:integrase
LALLRWVALRVLREAAPLLSITDVVTEPHVAELTRVKGGWSVRIRCGVGQNPRFVIALQDERAAQARADKMREFARLMVAGGKTVEAPTMLHRAAEQTTAAGFREVESFIAEMCKDVLAKAAAQRPVTFRDLAERWTNGELARLYPDHVRVKRSVANDVIRLARLYPVIGDVPLTRFSVEDAKRAMASLPDGRAPATRRHYAQLISRVLKMAVFPLEIIDAYPLPPGFLPRVSGRPAFGYLYPSEEAELMACREVTLGMRLLYGFLAREGLRLGEAVGLRWEHLDLRTGTIRLDTNKTDEPRSWALSRGVVAALERLRETRRGESRVFPQVNDKAARQFREHLKLAGIKRAELFERTKSRRPIRVHDLRATFITLALAGGRNETWVQDRTGHTTSAMLNRYRRQARHASELSLGELMPLNEAIPELCSDTQGVNHWVSQSSDQGEPVDERFVSEVAGSPSRARTGTPLPARDFKSPASAIPPRGRSRRRR